MLHLPTPQFRDINIRENVSFWCYSFHFPLSSNLLPEFCVCSPLPSLSSISLGPLPIHTSIHTHTKVRSSPPTLKHINLRKSSPQSHPSTHTHTHTPQGVISPHTTHTYTHTHIRRLYPHIPTHTQTLHTWTSAFAILCDF